MDAPLYVLWAEKPNSKFALMGWSNESDHERVSLRDVESNDPKETINVPIDEVSFDDPKTPNLFMALQLLRNFRQYELMRVRHAGGLVWSKPDLCSVSAMKMVEDLEEIDSPSAEDFCDGLGPKERRIMTKRLKRTAVDSLWEVPEAERDYKTCAIHVERDHTQYTFVPMKHQTDAMVALYKQSQRRHNEEEEAEAAARAAAAEEATRNAEAAEEAKKAKRRDADKARRERKKQEANGEAVEPPPKKRKKSTEPSAAVQGLIDAGILKFGSTNKMQGCAELWGVGSTSARG